MEIKVTLTPNNSIITISKPKASKSQLKKRAYRLIKEAKLTTKIKIK